MNINFDTYNDFLAEYQVYEFDVCDNCTGVRELLEDDVTVTIGRRKLHLLKLPVLCCTKCGQKCFPEFSKQMIDGAYNSMIKYGKFSGEFSPKNYKKKFEYCQAADYNYDHKDYYSIPGLCHDDEHTNEGFLTPVYFDRKALIYFIAVPDFEVDIFSETYGSIGKKDSTRKYPYEWIVPFGFNSNGKLVFWLGDLDNLDTQSQMILKGFNVESDHLLIDSEFYQGQMKCTFSDPIKEKQILSNKNIFISNIKMKYAIDLTHLEEECTVQAKNVKRPLVFTEESVSGVINAFDKILVEGFNVVELRKLYELLYPESERNAEYRKWQSIRLIKEVLLKLCDGIKSTIDVEILISPLYILHDYRIYFDHLLSADERKKSQAHIVSTLGVHSFDEQEAIYFEEIERLNKLFQYLVLLSK